MTTSTAMGMMVVAGVLGVTHAVEPDHVAGISALSNGAADTRLAAMVGGCFAFGHVLLVVAWIGVATVFLDLTALLSVVETVGHAAVGGALVLASVWLGVSAAGRLVHRHEHSHGGVGHAHFHVHRFGPGHAPHAGHDHEHTPVEYLKMATVGALFALSPPLSMIAFVSVVLSAASTALVVPVVLAYAGAITLTMSAIGYGAGTALGLARASGPRVHAALQLGVAGVVLLVAVHVLGVNLPSPVPW